MNFHDLAGYLAALQKRGELLEIDAPLDPHLEIASLADKLVKRGGPAAIIRNPVTGEMPVAVNLFGTKERTAFALGCRNFDELTARVASYVDVLPPGTLFEKMKLVNQFAGLRHIMPRTVKKAPCQDVVLDSAPLLSRLPVLTTWPDDGGPFITLPLIFTKDPDNGVQNCGMYRMQIYSETETGMHFHPQKDGQRHLHKAGKKKQPLECAVALGCDPAIIYSATAPLPPDIDEMILAGFIRGEGVEMVKGKFTDLLVPAHAEIILEGTIDPEETRWEGPFGDHTGFYSLADHFPVFRLRGMTMKKNPIYPATVVGPPPMEDCWLGKVTERFFLPLLKKAVPEIIDYDLPIEGIFHNFVIVSIEKTYPGQARKVMMALWGLGQMQFSKCILVVDQDVDVHNYKEVFWHALNCLDPKRDLLVTEGPADCLEHASPAAHIGGKVGLDATKKLPGEHDRPWPDRLKMTPEVERRVEAVLREAALRP